LFCQRKSREKGLIQELHFAGQSRRPMRGNTRYKWAAAVESLHTSDGTRRELMHISQAGALSIHGRFIRLLYAPDPDASPGIVYLLQFQKHMPEASCCRVAIVTDRKCIVKGGRLKECCKSAYAANASWTTAASNLVSSLSRHNVSDSMPVHGPLCADPAEAIAHGPCRLGRHSQCAGFSDVGIIDCSHWPVMPNCRSRCRLFWSSR
jgi:hypothetical protein